MESRSYISVGETTFKIAKLPFTINICADEQHTAPLDYLSLCDYDAYINTYQSPLNFVMVENQYYVHSPYYECIDDESVKTTA